MPDPANDRIARVAYEENCTPVGHGLDEQGVD